MKIPVARVLTLGLSVALAVGTAVYAQHAYTPADLEEGGRLFRANCSNCHGADGNGQLGAPLTTGKFKRASNEDEAARLVRAGIASVGMPAFNNISELQAGAILSFLRTSAATVATPDAPVTLGDATRGRAIFEGKGECLKCHRVNGQGARWAPDLSTVGAPRGGGGGGGRGAAPAPAAAAPAAPAAEPSPQQLQQLQRALLDPNADVADANRTYRAVMQGGETITGKLLNLDTFYAQLLDTTDRLVTVDKQKARQFGVIPSPMPSYRDKLSAQELSDLLGYLASLK